jgi:hypothetical protein
VETSVPKGNKRMLAGFFHSRSGKKRPLLPDILSDSNRNWRSLPCELWTEFGIPHLAEVKLERPSALAILVVQQART